MNIINWLKSRSGKFALSTAQTIGAAAVVGVVGIAGWQVLSSPKVNPDAIFSAQDEEITYVAGGPGGHYSGVGYGEGGELKSAVRVSKSRGMELMEQDALRMQQEPQTQLDADEQEIKAFKMDGASEGLGMGHNAAKERGGGQAGDMSAVQAQIDAISAMAKQKQQDAQAAAAANGDVAQAATLAKAGRGWGNMNSAMARANGNNLNSTPLQAGGPGSLRGGTLGGSRAREGQSLASSGRSGNFDASREAMLQARRVRPSGNTLDDMAKHSASLTKGPRSANEGASVFLASGRGVDALQLGDSAVSSLGDTSSDDYTGASLPDLSGFAGAGQSYSEAKEKMIEDLKEFRDHAAGWGSIPIIGPIILSAKYVAVKKKIDAFNEAWGETAYEANNTRGAFGNNAKTALDRMYASAWYGWFIGPLVAWENVSKEYWPEAAPEEDEENKDK